MSCFERERRNALPSPAPESPARADPDAKRGLYEKFHVRRLNDPTGKHADCRYFVLDLDHDRHARAALWAYLSSCREEYPALAADLRRLLDGFPAPASPPEVAP